MFRVQVHWQTVKVYRMQCTGTKGHCKGVQFDVYMYNGDSTGVQCTVYRNTGRQYRCTVSRGQVHRHTVQVYKLPCSGTPADCTRVLCTVYKYTGRQYNSRQYRCIIGWCEINLLLKIRNPQSDYGSMGLLEQFLIKVFVHSMHFFSFLQNLPQIIRIFTLPLWPKVIF